MHQSPRKINPMTKLILVENSQLLANYIFIHHFFLIFKKLMKFKENNFLFLSILSLIVLSLFRFLKNIEIYLKIPKYIL